MDNLPRFLRKSLSALVAPWATPAASDCVLPFAKC